jgi:hypothetical protein
MIRSPLSRPEDVERYAEGLRRAGLREAGSVSWEEQAALTFQHSLIDLVPEAPHSPVRNESHKREAAE